MANEIATQDSATLVEQAGEGLVDSAGIEVLKRVLARQREDQKPPTDEELAIFLQTAKHLELDPFANQINFLKFDQRSPYQAYVTWEGLIAIAERTGKFDGLEGPWWTADGVGWVEVWLDKEPPKAAKVAVYKKGVAKPFVGICRYDSYVRMTFKNGKPTPMANWRTMPDRMLAKSALRLALKTAFPRQMAKVDQAAGVDVELEGVPDALEGRTVTDGRPGEEMSKDQRGLLFSLAKELGLSDDERHEYSEGKSWGELTAAEAGRIAGALIDRQNQEHPIADPFAGIDKNEPETAAISPESDPEPAEGETITEAELIEPEPEEPAETATGSAPQDVCGAWGPDGDVCVLADGHGGSHDWATAPPAEPAEKPKSRLDQLPADLKALMVGHFGTAELAEKVLGTFLAAKGIDVWQMRDEHYEALRKTIKPRAATNR